MNKDIYKVDLFDPESYYNDINVVSNALKSYLRELPEPLITFELYDYFMAAASLFFNLLPLFLLPSRFN